MKNEGRDRANGSPPRFMTVFPEDPLENYHLHLVNRTQRQGMLDHVDFFFLKVGHADLPPRAQGFQWGRRRGRKNGYDQGPATSVTSFFVCMLLARLLSSPPPSLGPVASTQGSHVAPSIPWPQTCSRKTHSEPTSLTSIACVWVNREACLPLTIWNCVVLDALAILRQCGKQLSENGVNVGRSVAKRGQRPCLCPSSLPQCQAYHQR